MMRVLITGAAGFLGSHLADRFLAEGYEVVGVDNLATGSRANIAHLEDDPRFSFRERDVARPFSTAPKLSAVLHFASPASPPAYRRLPIETMMAGGPGTKNTLDIAREHGARYVLASTSEVYGDPQVHPQTEDYWGHVNPIGPRSVYDVAKRYSEALATAYRKTHGVETRIARIFNTYGPRVSVEDGRVVSNLIVQCLRGEPMTVYGTGLQTRSFCYVEDQIEGIFRLLQSKYSQPVNIGGPREYTILELAQIVAEEAGVRAELIKMPLPADDPAVRCPDISLARRELGWSPVVGLREGIRKTISYFRGVLGKGG